MDFSFNQDQLLIAETASTFLTDVSDSASVRLAMNSEQGWDETLWHKISQELGWPMTHIPEEQGGLGLGFVELAILFEQSGKHLLCSPLFSSIALSSMSFLVSGSKSSQSHLEAIASGERYALAYSGGGRAVGCDSITAEFTVKGNGFELNGDYAYVIDGHTASKLIVAARSPGSYGQQGIAFFVLDAETEGLKREWTASMDQTRKLAKLSLSNVLLSQEQLLSISVDKGADEGGDVLEQALALASICLAAEQLGVADQSLQMTVDFIAERKQFGRAVGSFQAMKHKAADMMLKVEAGRSAVYYAACIADEFMQGSDIGQELLEAASIAKSYACDAAFFNAGCAIQMHGGVGFTWEYDVHLYFKRAKSAQTLLGDSAWHKERLASFLLDEPQKVTV